MSSLSSGLLCHCGPRLPAIPQGTRCPRRKPRRSLTTIAQFSPGLCCIQLCKYSQGKEKCPSLGQTLPLQGSQVLQGRKSMGRAGRGCACGELTVPRGAKERRLHIIFGNHRASLPLLLRVSSSTGWRLQFFLGSSEQGFAVER